MLYDLICQNCNSPFQHKWYKKKTCSASCASKLKFKNWSPEKFDLWKKNHGESLSKTYREHPEIKLQQAQTIKEGYVSGRLQLPRSCFQKGHKPVNKGKTWEEVVGKERALEMKLQSSLRKKGQPAWNKGLTMKDERVRKNVQGIIKFAKDNKGKTYEEKYGEEIGKLKRINISKKLTGQKRTPEQIETYKKSNGPKAWKGLRALALKNETRIEKRMKEILIELNMKFEQEKVVFSKGPVRFRVDFCLPEHKIFIECDGEAWHKDKEKDKNREDEILKIFPDYKFIRFTGKQINKNTDSVYQELVKYIYK